LEQDGAKTSRTVGPLFACGSSGFPSPSSGAKFNCTCSCRYEECGSIIDCPAVAHPYRATGFSLRSPLSVEDDVVFPLILSTIYRPALLSEQLAASPKRGLASMRQSSIANC